MEDRLHDRWRLPECPTTYVCCEIEDVDNGVDKNNKETKMREMKVSEITDVTGAGNKLVPATNIALRATGYFGAGVTIGSGVNYFNEKVSGMSLGEAIYYTLN